MQRQRPVPGWPTLAAIITERPDLGSFPTFTDLSVKSLLYYQAELIFLRKRLHKAEWKEYRQAKKEGSKFPDNQNLHKSILAHEQALKKGDKVPEQWMYIDRIRTTLERYHAALLQFSEIAALREADNCNISSLRSAVRECCQDGLIGTGAETWGDIGNTSEMSPRPKSLRELTWGLVTGCFKSPDPERTKIPDVFQEHLIVPHKGSKPDGLTQWVKQSFIPFYERLQDEELLPWLWHLLIWHKAVEIWRKACEIWRNLHPEEHDSGKLEKQGSSTTSPSGSTRNGPMTPPSPTLTNGSESSVNNITNNLNHYSGSWIQRIASIITTVVACLLPVVAITILAEVRSIGLILGLIAIFTAIFAAGLGVISSSSSRVEIFTATAAFSAVMVVFVQNQIGPQ